MPSWRTRSSRTARPIVIAEIAVTGATNGDQAKAIARRIATSPLVKTALFGHDPNWGRVLMAVGSAPYNGGYADVEVDRLTLSYNGTVVLRRGAPQWVEPDVSPELHHRARPRARDGQRQLITTDLSYDYVRINAEYTT